MAAWRKVEIWEQAQPEDRPGDVEPVGTAWSRIWTIGNRSILDQKLVAMFCSGRCPGDAIVRTYELARALRDSGIPVIGGFHSAMEKECLDLLLRGSQAIVICPARSIEQLRIPAKWRSPIDEGRLLVVSPFSAGKRRPTVIETEERNRLVAYLASAVFIAHASPGGKIQQLCRELQHSGKQLWTLGDSTSEPLRSLGCRFLASPDECVRAYQATLSAGGRES